MGGQKSIMTPKKVASIISMQEQVVETGDWKRSRGLNIESDKCRVCGEKKETVMHILSGCRVLARKQFTERHDKGPKILAKKWEEEKGIAIDKHNNEEWERGTVFEGGSKKIDWDIEFNLGKMETGRLPDLVLEDGEEMMIYVVDMACPSETECSRESS